LFAVLAVFFCVGMYGLQPNFSAEKIKWGVLIDLSGPTSDWGKNQVKGQLDAARLD
jgi:hypothetical protein